MDAIVNLLVVESFLLGLRLGHGAQHLGLLAGDESLAAILSSLSQIAEGHFTTLQNSDELTPPAASNAPEDATELDDARAEARERERWIAATVVEWLKQAAK